MINGPIHGRTSRLIVAAAAGAVAVGGFAPLGISLLPVLSLAALLLVWRRCDSPADAALAGFIFGLAFFGAGVSWVYVSLHDFGMMAAPIAALATLLFCAYLALFPAATGFVRARLGGGFVSTCLLTAPALWTVTEWLRGWLLTGFPWLAVGYSQPDSPLAGFAPLAGVYAVSLGVAICAGLLALAVSSTSRKRLAAVAGIASLLLVGGLLRYPEWTEPRGNPVAVALVQGNIPQSLKFEPDRYQATLDTYRRLVTETLVTGTSARIIVMPETAIPRFLDLVDPAYLGALERIAAASSADLLVGAPLRDRSGAYYNGVVSMGSSPPQAYHKVHLVPFGEFIPPAFGWVLDLLRIPLSDFSRGRVDQKPLRLGDDIRVAVNVCYEDAFGAEIARQLPEANLLVNTSNVAWFGDSLAPEQHLQISRMRAIETGRSMLRATNTGVTAIIDERGNVVARLPRFVEGVVSGTAQPMSGATPFIRFGDGPAVLLCLAMLVAAGIFESIRRRSLRNPGAGTAGG